MHMENERLYCMRSFLCVEREFAVNEKRRISILWIEVLNHQLLKLKDQIEVNHAVDTRDSEKIREQTEE